MKLISDCHCNKGSSVIVDCLFIIGVEKSECSALVREESRDIHLLPLRLVWNFPETR